MALSKRSFAPLVAVCAAWLPAAAMADAAPPSAEQAKTLQRQIQAWLTDVTAGSVKIPPDAVRLTPEGDHYRVTVPLDQLGTVEPKDAVVTASAKMIDGTHWQIDDQKLPPSFKLTTKVSVPDAPPPPKHGAPPAKPAPLHFHTETATYTVHVDAQTSHAVFDPTYATGSTSESSLSNLDVKTVGPSIDSDQHWDKFAGHSDLRPVAAGKVDAAADAVIDGWHLKQALPDGTHAQIDAKRLHVVAALAGVAQDKVIPVIHAAVATAKAASASSKSPNDTALETLDRTDGRALLVAANGLLTGGRLEETAEGLAFDFGGHAGGLNKITIAFGGDAPQDMLTAKMTIGLDGLTVAELPPAFAVYMPSHILLTPSVSNLSAAALTKLAMDASAPNAKSDPPPGDIDALFSQGGIVLGLDEFGLDIAGAKVSGTGKFTLTSPNEINGNAELTASGLDGLITQAQANPLLQQGVPVLIFLKGIAHMSGDVATWQIAVANTAVTVNGVNLSALTAGMH